MSKSDNKINYNPENLIIYCDQALDTIKFEDLSRWHIFIDKLHLQEIIKEKFCKPEIIKINDQEIDDKQGKAYLTALTTQKWSQLNEYVNNK